MKIAFLIPGIDAKGPNIFTLNLIKGLLATKKIYCEVFHFGRGGEYDELKFPVPVKRIHLFEKRDFSSFDIIHSTMPYPDFYIVLHGLNKTHKCLTSLHNIMKNDLYQRRGKVVGFVSCLVWKFCLNRIHNIVVSSEQMKASYKSILSKRHCYTTIPYGIPQPELGDIDNEIREQLTDLKKKYKLIVGCGGLIKRKGFWQLVNYLPHNKSVAVVLIGDGPCESELKEQAVKLQVSERVIFLGFRNHSYNYYPYFDVYCMTSNSEGFGLAMLEAMALGLPVVCSNLDIYHDYFSDEDVSLFDYGNQQSLNDAIDKALKNESYFSDKSKSLYNQKFSLESMANRHLLLYNSLLCE